MNQKELDLRRYKKKYDYRLKVVIVGSAFVGKSCILLRYMNNMFPID